MERSYILVHQTGLADTAIPEDDDLQRGISLETVDFGSMGYVGVHSTFKRTFFLELMVGGCVLLLLFGARKEEEEGNG
jgi:hypothetical protein